MENNKTNGLNGYKAFYNDKETDIWANDLYEAKQKAIAYFKPKKSKEHMVSVHLCEKANGEQVEHTPDF